MGNTRALRYAAAIALALAGCGNLDPEESTHVDESALDDIHRDIEQLQAEAADLRMEVDQMRSEVDTLESEKSYLEQRMDQAESHSHY